MGLFNRQEGVIGSPMAARMRSTEPKPVQEIVMVIEYFDKATETISLTYNLEELQRLVSSSFSTGASMNFPSARPPFTINPRWVKKVTYKVKGVIPCD
ncbi:thiopurine S-methyltransferase [Streptococcus anginosus]|uniref:thiopurine S-methyltransferase n=1 Tax=Streptococcus anginosus TaxID=1328 RepID=UPI001430FE6B|nr:thiopurine S-methyltransferase [Streptococcus anginosus]NJJ28082.1 thiopurine S-methyltransferase [Streptococcus anginosus]